MGQIDFATKK